MARRKKESAIDFLFTLPWWVSGLLAGAALLIPSLTKLIFPPGQSQAGPIINNAFVPAAELFSPILAGVLFIIALFVLIKDTFKNRKTTASSTSQNRPTQKRKQATPQRKSKRDSRVADILADRVYSEDQTVTAPTRWSLELLQSIEWKRFEELCEAVFNEINLVARNTVFGADGGIDIKLYDKNSPDTLVAIAQCKAWSTSVGVKEIREFYGVMVAAKINKAYFVTTSSFTKDAIKFSKTSEVTLINGKQLLKLITSRSPEKSAQLLKLATVGDYTTPTCPSCGLKMVTRTVSNSGNQFWGCSSYPRCKGKLNMKKGN